MATPPEIGKAWVFDYIDMTWVRLTDYLAHCPSYIFTIRQWQHHVERHGGACREPNRSSKRPYARGGNFITGDRVTDKQTRGRGIVRLMS
jgi:hypothetical protein